MVQMGRNALQGTTPTAHLNSVKEIARKVEKVAGRLDEVETPGLFPPEQPRVKQNLGQARYLSPWQAEKKLSCSPPAHFGQPRQFPK